MFLLLKVKGWKSKDNFVLSSSLPFLPPIFYQIWKKRIVVISYFYPIWKKKNGGLA